MWASKSSFFRKWTSLVATSGDPGLAVQLKELAVHIALLGQALVLQFEVEVPFAEDVL